MGGLSNNSNYYVVNANTSVLQLSSAAGGSPIDLTSAPGSTETHSLVHVPAANSHHLSNVNNTTENVVEKILSEYKYNLAKTSDQAGAGHRLLSKTPLTGLDLYSSYYVVESDSKSVKLSLSANGTPINIVANANAEIGHYLTKIIEEL